MTTYTLCHECATPHALADMNTCPHADLCARCDDAYGCRECRRDAADDREAGRP